MSAFRFPLQKALDLRRSQLQTAEARLREQLAALAVLDRARGELEIATRRAVLEVRSFRALSGEDLCALESFRAAAKRRAGELVRRRVACQREVAVLQAALLEARRKCRLLDRLRERREAEWQSARDREWEQLAADSYMAQWSR